jgi:hypothetical protein|tara:strand:- start:338 stop:511 length:174 start_codon:yes stop_codon:yes gene_type:complete
MTDLVWYALASLGIIQAIHGLGFLYVLRWMFWRNEQLTDLLVAHYKENPLNSSSDEE